MGKKNKQVDVAVLSIGLVPIAAMIGLIGYCIYNAHSIAAKEAKAAEILAWTKMPSLVTIDKIPDADRDPKGIRPYLRCETSSGGHGWKVCDRFSSREEAEKQSLVQTGDANSFPVADPTVVLQFLKKSCANEEARQSLKKECDLLAAAQSSVQSQR